MAVPELNLDESPRAATMPAIEPAGVLKPAPYIVDLYLEHLEEAGFLYEQRLLLLDDPQLTWRDLSDFEARFEAHLDALLIGGDPALDVCVMRAAEADAGELYAMALLFCRVDRLSAMMAVFEVVDADDARKIAAISSALEQTLPEKWLMELLRSLGTGNDVIDRVIARVIGYTRLKAAMPLISVLPRSGATDSIVWALGRLRDSKAQAPLRSLMREHKDTDIRGAATQALARMGDLEALNECQRQIFTEHWARFELGLAGGRSTVRALLAAVAKSPDVEGVLALGMLGDVQALPALVGFLRTEEFVAEAASALELITGAGLYEEVFIADEIDPDELFEDERKRFDRGESVSEGVDGATVRRLTRDPEKWTQWWRDNQSQFNGTMRYRYGKLYSPSVLIDALADGCGGSRVCRELAYEELVIRYGADLAFESDLPSQRQQAIVDRYREWANARIGQTQDGAWYFAGQLLAS
ncbi:MAG: HEAT repeat domain-containing protein [bacterium]|nr:HEAT repeat domain-containing protein [Candidatus Kapabacteria bacterium]